MLKMNANIIYCTGFTILLSIKIASSNVKSFLKCGNDKNTSIVLADEIFFTFG